MMKAGWDGRGWFGRGARVAQAHRRWQQISKEQASWEWLVATNKWMLVARRLFSCRSLLSKRLQTSQLPPPPPPPRAAARTSLASSEYRYFKKDSCTNLVQALVEYRYFKKERFNNLVQALVELHQSII